MKLCEILKHREKTFDSFLRSIERCKTIKDIEWSERGLHDFYEQFVGVAYAVGVYEGFIQQMDFLKDLEEWYSDMKKVIAVKRSDIVVEVSRNE